MNTSVFSRPSGKGLGTFLGVFTPTILTILGVIMYLRFGWVLGQVGLLKTLLIVALANSITLATSLSLSSIATNSRVGVGGAYYMISRSLGIEIGGAIGLPLFLSQALSVTLYAYGLAESIRFIWPGVPILPAAFLIIVVVALLSYRGAAFALKAQIPVLVLIGASLLALATGAFTSDPVTFTGEAPDLVRVTFWQVFAVFFPAVTGIMAGLSLSGDLTDPRKSLPRGTLAAVVCGFVIYLTVPVLLSLGGTPEALRNEALIWTRIAVLGPWLVLPGLWGAIFSSAVGSMLGAPRTLSALASDGLVPRFLRARTAEKDREPLAGYIVTFLLAFMAVLLGDLNTVATVVTMFFLSVYGLINLVAAVEKIAGNPFWRPTLNTPWYVSLPTAMACFGVMLLIHWPATLVALSIELFLWIFFKRRHRREAWGDVRRDLYEAMIRWALIRLSKRPMTARNWRPHILIFTRDLEKRLDLVQYGAWFSENRGVVTVCELIEGDIRKLDVDTNERQRFLERILDREGLVAFPEVNVVWDIERGILAVVQANGLAGLDSNTVLLGWPDDPARLESFLRIARRLSHLKRSLVIGKPEFVRMPMEGEKRSIDVWWGGLKRNGDLMLLLAYLLSQNPEWHNARIRILSLASNELMQGSTTRFLENLIREIRIDADIIVNLKPEDKSVFDVMCEESHNADAVLLGLALPEEGEEKAYAEKLVEMVECLPNCFFVHNGSLFIGDLVMPVRGEEVAVEAS